jgi:hypothetical protein
MRQSKLAFILPIFVGLLSLLNQTVAQAKETDQDMSLALVGGTPKTPYAAPTKSPCTIAEIITPLTTARSAISSRLKIFCLCTSSSGTTS